MVRFPKNGIQKIHKIWKLDGKFIIQRTGLTLYFFLKPILLNVFMKTKRKKEAGNV